MIKRFLALLMVFALLQNTALHADGDDEGMWLPFLIQKMKIKEMQQMGLKLSAEEIFSINNGSLKDAVIALDHGSCTGELVSPEGLFFTNHHCGYGEIQAHSTVENDYLTEGFWAENKKEELPNPGKTVSFLISVKDVTDEINKHLNANMPKDERDAVIKRISSELTAEATKDNWYEADVESFYEGNDFYLFVYETFKDVRLVGAPPSSIGKYGADTDNWMWPRHTGDFSLFRIYTGPDGKPAEYSEDNIPYKPKHFFPISIKGFKENDFAMVMGYPGSTSRYLTSWEVEQTMENENKIRIKLRGIKQRIMKKEMDASDKVRIQYASKYSRSTNYYKYSIGQNKGLKNLNVIDKKEDFEKSMKKWVKNDVQRKNKYKGVMKTIKKSVKATDEYDIASNYWIEAFWLGPEVIKFSWTTFRQLMEYAQSEDEELRDKLDEKQKEFFKDYYQAIDKKIFVAMMKTYKEDIDDDFHPTFFEIVESDYNGSFESYADFLYENSIFTDEDRFEDFLDNPDVSLVRNDPGFQLANSVIGVYGTIGDATAEYEAKLAKARRLFVQAWLKKEDDKAHYPDANSTMRFTYGTVGGYTVNGKDMPFKTNLKGYMAKENEGAPTDDEFYVHQKLKDLYKAKDYGKYAEDDGSMTVCFITNNDITGGNSGSPVLNGEGHLIGIAFDGNWEAMSGDIAFETDLQRCINVDIRFVLFVMDKYAGASHLIDEMTIIE